MSEIATRSAIAQLIYDMPSYHGLVLFIPIPEPSDPNKGLNCRFDDYNWLRRNPEPVKEIADLFSNLPPTGSNRITIWTQSNRGSSKNYCYQPLKALEKYEALMSRYNKSWEDVQVIWSHPRNQPQWQIEKPTHSRPEETEDLPVLKNSAVLPPSNR